MEKKLYGLGMQQEIRQTLSKSRYDKVRVKGCWFHFCQTLLTKLGKLELLPLCQENINI